jgi:hypothetical protein
VAFDAVLGESPELTPSLKHGESYPLEADQGDGDIVHLHGGELGELGK